MMQTAGDHRSSARVSAILIGERGAFMAEWCDVPADVLLTSMYSNVRTLAPARATLGKLPDASFFSVVAVDQAGHGHHQPPP